MVRFFANFAISLVANAIGLLAASAFLSGFSVEGMSFVVAVAIFTLSTVILGPFILSMALKNATFLVGGIALVTTLVGLIVTNLVTDGISITGLNTWIIATLIIWVFSVAANLVLPLFMFKNIIRAKKS
jgi:uncharacterized membrane protein YvlD (DUF360 family)